MKFENWCHGTLIFIGFGIVHVVSISLLSSTRTSLLARVQHCQPLSQSKFIPSEYCIRIMRESYACGLKTSISEAYPGARPPPYFWTKLRPEGPKNIFFKPPSSPYLRVWMTPSPPPPYLKVWIRHWISRLSHKSRQIVLNTWWLWVLFSVVTKSYQSTLKVSSFK